MVLIQRKKFTFKKTVRTGRYKSLQRNHTTIKLDKLEVGYISESTDHSGYRIALAVKKLRTEKEPANFKWIFFKKRFPDELSAREWLNHWYVMIQEKYDIYQFKED